MKHILHVIQSLEFGGAEKIVVQLANKFCKDYKVTVCVTKRTGELVCELDGSVNVISMDMGEGNNPKLITHLREFIVKNAVDVVHCHDWGVYLESVLAARKKNRPRVILTVHGPYTHYSAGLISAIKIKVRHIVERYLSASTYRIVAVSDSIKRYIVDDIKIDAEKVRVIHNGVQGYEFSRKVPAQHCRKFITVGRIAAIKNHRLMLEALSEVLKSVKNVSLTVVGDGPEYNDIRKFAKELGVQESVTFTGFRTDIEELLLRHDAFLLSSHYEGISIAGLEAMSLGLPIVSTNVGGVSEMIQEGVNGLLVEKNNLEEFTSCLKRVCTEYDLFLSLSKRSREVFYNKFQEKKMLHDYKTLYEEKL